MSIKYLSAILLFSCTLSSYAEVNEALLKKANSGNIAAIMQVGDYYYENGDDIDLDWNEALKWYEKAAEKNNVEAMIKCGEILLDEYNLYSDPDYVRGIAWYRKAAGLGSAEAKQILADIKFVKEEISHDCPFDYLPCDDDFDRIEELVANEALIKQAYEKKNPIAGYYLALIAYSRDKDYKKAVDYLTEIYPVATDENNTFEPVLTGDELLPPITVTLGSKVLSLLGWCYENGIGTNQDYKKAAEYYLTDFDFSAYGMPEISKVRGAYCYKKAGLYDKFIKEAQIQGYGSWLDYADEDRIPVGCLQLELAEMYRNGEGVPQDKKKALEILENLVDKRKKLHLIFMNLPEVRSYEDIGRAAYRASKMYENGEGCKPDPVMAKLYFDIALKYGDNNAWYETQNN